MSDNRGFMPWTGAIHERLQSTRQNQGEDDLQMRRGFTPTDVPQLRAICHNDAAWLDTGALLMIFA